MHCPRNSGNAFASKIGCSRLTPSGLSRLCAAVVTVHCVHCTGRNIRPCTIDELPIWVFHAKSSGGAGTGGPATTTDAGGVPLSLPGSACYCNLPSQACFRFKCRASTAFPPPLRISSPLGGWRCRHACVSLCEGQARLLHATTTSALWTARCASVASRTGRCCAPCLASTSTTQVLAWQAPPPRAHRSPQGPTAARKWPLSATHLLGVLKLCHHAA